VASYGGDAGSSSAKSSFSNYGTCIDVWSPGSYILSTYGNSDTALGIMSGTSMACPHVSGLVAIMLEAYPSASGMTASERLNLLSALNRTDWVTGIPTTPASVNLVPLAPTVARAPALPTVAPTPAPLPYCLPGYTDQFRNFYYDDADGCHTYAADFVAPLHGGVGESYSWCDDDTNVFNGITYRADQVCEECNLCQDQPASPAPTQAPTAAPTPVPTLAPTPAPTAEPTPAPTPVPTPAPTLAPTPAPTPAPTVAPTHPVLVSAGYTADEILPAGVVSSDLMNSVIYKAAKASGLCAALSVPCSDLTITGFSVNPRRLSATVSDTVSVTNNFTVHSVTTNFTVQVADESAGQSVSSTIAGAADGIKTETDSAMAAADWGTDPVIQSAPTMTTPVVASASLTVVPTPAPIAGPVSGVGDPHLTNMFGQRFDLYRTGVNVLFQIPREVSAQHALLHVEADARRIGTCSDVYFQIVNISGAWARQSERHEFFATADKKSNSMTWTRFGKIDLKVVRGRTRDNIDYLNVFARRLGMAGYAVGGLLGEDDHVDAMTPPPECAHVMTLMASDSVVGWDPSLFSVAEASLA